MTFDAIINGAGGVIYWGAPYLPKQDPTWESLKSVAAELGAARTGQQHGWRSISITQSLAATNGNVTAAAKKLGISRRTLHRKINEMNPAKAEAESASEKTH